MLTHDGQVLETVGKAPQADHSAKQPFIEVGAWRIRKLRRGAQVIDFFPWTAVEDIPTRSPVTARPKGDPLILARHYQSLLDSGAFRTQAELARHLGVSRVRVTQVLRRLKLSDKPLSDDSPEATAADC